MQVLMHFIVLVSFGKAVITDFPLPKETAFLYLAGFPRNTAYNI